VPFSASPEIIPEAEKTNMVTVRMVAMKTPIESIT
jgi:hypothetical protein